MIVLTFIYFVLTGVISLASTSLFLLGVFGFNGISPLEVRVSFIIMMIFIPLGVVLFKAMVLLDKD